MMQPPAIVRLRLDLAIDRALFPNEAYRRGGVTLRRKAAKALKEDTRRIVQSHLVAQNVATPVYDREQLSIATAIYWEREWVVHKTHGTIRQFRRRIDLDAAIASLKPLADGLQAAGLLKDDRRIVLWGVTQHHDEEREASLDVTLRVVRSARLPCRICHTAQRPVWAGDDLLGVWCPLCRRLDTYPEGGDGDAAP